jgi:hypothetical protein
MHVVDSWVVQTGVLVAWKVEPAYLFLKGSRWSIAQFREYWIIGLVSLTVIDSLVEANDKGKEVYL